MPHDTRDAVVAFLYELMRDEVTPGVVERIATEQASPDGWKLTNEHIALYAEEIATRLAEQTTLIERGIQGDLVKIKKGRR